jgi:hypothetical protein
VKCVALTGALLRRHGIHLPSDAVKAARKEASRGPYWHRRAQAGKQICIETELGEVIEKRISAASKTSA